MAWSTHATHGTLTAEQVREAVNGHGNIMDNRFYCDWQAIADELNAMVGGDGAARSNDGATVEDVDAAYMERIRPRLLKEGSPTEAIREWSVRAHSVMELTGPEPFGMDGSAQLWLHERSLTQLLDMCDEVDERFEMLGGGECELTAFADVPFNVDYEIEGYDSSSGNDYAALAECSKCGAYVIVPPAYHHVLTCDGDEVYQPYRYCPNCRREVVDE